MHLYVQDQTGRCLVSNEAILSTYQLIYKWNCLSSLVHRSLYFKLKTVWTGRAYVHRRSADTNLVEIHKEMSELLDKQVNVQKESLFRGSCASSRKVCNEKKQRKK